MPPCPTERLRRAYKDPKASSVRPPAAAPTCAEAARCVAVCAPWVRPLAILLYYTGLRVGQARSLTWDQVFLDGPRARDNGGPVLWIGGGKTRAESDGRFLPIHPALADWLRARRANPGSPDYLHRDLRRSQTKAGRERLAAFEAGRIAWEVADQNVSLQMTRAWKAASVDPAVWANRPDHAFRKALRTNVMERSTEPGAKAWQAAERLLGHKLPGQLDTYQSDRVLMPTMRALIGALPRWEEAALVVVGADDSVGDAADLGDDMAALG